MVYTTTTKVKLMLGITWSWADALLTQMIADAGTTVDTLLNIDWFDEATITEQVPKKQIRFGQYGVRIYLKNFNVSSLVSIDWNAYTWVLWTDYKIKYSRMIEIKDFVSSLPSDQEFSSLDVEYVYWYDRTPTDLLPANVELMTRLLVVGEYTFMYPTWYNASALWTITGGWNGISSYKLWEEAISWKWSGNSSSGWSSFTSFRTPEERNLFQQLLAKYRKTNVLH